MNADRKPPLDLRQVPVNDETKGDSKVVSLIRAELRRAQRLANERDLMRALTLHKPDGDEAA